VNGIEGNIFMRHNFKYHIFERHTFKHHTFTGCTFKGYTFVEVMVATTILITLLTGLFIVLGGIRRSNVDTEWSSDTHLKLTRLVEILRRDIGAANNKVTIDIAHGQETTVACPMRYHQPTEAEISKLEKGVEISGALGVLAFTVNPIKTEGANPAGQTQPAECALYLEFDPKRSSYTIKYSGAGGRAEVNDIIGVSFVSSPILEKDFNDPTRTVSKRKLLEIRLNCGITEARADSFFRLKTQAANLEAVKKLKRDNAATATCNVDLVEETGFFAPPAGAL
jgi:hypothetical protein